MSVAYEDDITPNKINEWKHLDKLADKITQIENVSIDTFFNWQKLFQSTGAEVAYFRQEESPISFLNPSWRWIVGSVDKSENDIYTVYNRIAVQDLTSRPITAHYSSADTEVKDVQIEKMLHKMLSANFIDQSSLVMKDCNYEMSREDRRFMKMCSRKKIS